MDFVWHCLSDHYLLHCLFPGTAISHQIIGAIKLSQTSSFESVIGAQCENDEIAFRYLTRDKMCDNGKER